MEKRYLSWAFGFGNFRGNQKLHHHGKNKVTLHECKVLGIIAFYTDYST